MQFSSKVSRAASPAAAAPPSAERRFPWTPATMKAARARASASVPAKGGMKYRLSWIVPRYLTSVRSFIVAVRAAMSLLIPRTVWQA